MAPEIHATKQAGKEKRKRKKEPAKKERRKNEEIFVYATDT